MLGILIHNKFYFDEYVPSLYRKVSQKLNALERLVHYLNSGQCNLVITTFIFAQFDYFQYGGLTVGN